MRANGKFWVAKGPREMVAEGEFHGVNMGHREERVGGWRSGPVGLEVGGKGKIIAECEL